MSKASEKPQNGHLPPPLANKRPLTLAQAYLAHLGAGAVVRFWRGDFYRFDRFVYRKVVHEELVSDLTRFLNAVRVKADGHEWPLTVKKSTVSETLFQLEALCQARADAMPCWIGDARSTGRRPEPRDVIAFENGLLDVAEFVDDPRVPLLPPTPDWFSESVVPCYYDPRARCPQWLKFLNSTLEDDGELVGLLQEWFGYCLTGDTRQQKMLWLHGRAGAGKSTITQVLQQVVGRRNTVSFSLWDLTQRFTLSSFLGKTLAVSADAHLSKDTDSLRVIEQVKAIVGEDDRLVDRKNRELLPDIRLSVRLVVSVNSFPPLPDAGDTLRRRSLIIPFTRSFYGQEDPHLVEKLVGETPGVALWALEGLRRLRLRGRFPTTKKGQELQDRFTRLTSPIQSFVEECCELDAPEEKGDEPRRITKDQIYAAFKKWATENGHKVMAKDRFGEALMGTVPTIRAVRPREEGRRYHAYEGITLTAEANASLPEDIAAQHEEPNYMFR